MHFTAKADPLSSRTESNKHTRSWTSDENLQALVHMYTQTHTHSDKCHDT